METEKTKVSYNSSYCFILEPQPKRMVEVKICQRRPKGRSIEESDSCARQYNYFIGFSDDASKPDNFPSFK